jgi:hypothetical protein
MVERVRSVVLPAGLAGGARLRPIWWLVAALVILAALTPWPRFT